MYIVADHEVLSDNVMSAEPGEFYNYTSEFTIERPVFVLMKCKANKNRPVDQLPNLGTEANILFCFGDSSNATAYSIKAACELSLLDCIPSKQSFGDTFLGLPKITADDFNWIRSHKDTEILVEACREACSNRAVVVELSKGLVIAMMTDSDKYGMFLVQELTPVSIHIAACHILL